MRRAIVTHSEKDSRGRQHLSLLWVDRDGIHRKPDGPDGDGPVGLRRAQCFFVPVQSFIDDAVKRGDEVRVRLKGDPRWR